MQRFAEREPFGGRAAFAVLRGKSRDSECVELLFSGRMRIFIKGALQQLCLLLTRVGTDSTQPPRRATTPGGVWKNTGAHAGSLRQHAVFVWASSDGY